MATNLPTDIDATFPDRDGGDAEHQQHHDAIHAYTNTHDTAADPHGDRAWAAGQFIAQGSLFYNVKDYGATGDGTTDDSAAIQSAIDAAFATGGTVYIPAGKYQVGTPLYLDLRSTSGGPSGAPDTDTQRVDFRGAGRGNTVLRGTTDSMVILHVQGDNPLTAASHGYFTMSGFSLAGATPTARTATGLKLEDLAYLTVEEMSFHNLDVDLALVGALASTFRDLVFNESTTGVAASVGASGPHANLWSGCEFRVLTDTAYDGTSSLSSCTFLNCRFEGCGTMGSSTGIVKQSTGSDSGEEGMTFIGCYIENNAGTCDIDITETSGQRASLNIIGTCFNRVSSTNYVTNNIATSGNVDVNLTGNTFSSYPDYTADASRPHLTLSATSRLRDLGNRWEDGVESPVVGQALPFAGFVDGHNGATVGTAAVLPSGWTVDQLSTGIFQVIHNLGHTNYAVTATSCGTSVSLVQRVVPGVNDVQVVVVNSGMAMTDDDFSLQLQVLKPQA